MRVIRGMYLTSMDPIDPVLDIRSQVFQQGADPFDQMAVYALAMDRDDRPAGAARLFIDANDRFRLDYVGVVQARRGQGLGDLLLRMLLQRALDLGAPSIVLTAPAPLMPFFEKYGFRLAADGDMWATPDSIDRAGGCAGQCAGHD